MEQINADTDEVLDLSLPHRNNIEHSDDKGRNQEETFVER